MTYHYESISPHSTPRKCSQKCMATAQFWRYTFDKRGGVDRSSKQPVCAAHGPLNG